MITQQLFSFNDVALRWGCSAFTVRRRVDDGSIQSVNVGARRMINLTEILRVEAGGAGKPRPGGARKERSTKARRGSAEAPVRG